MTVKITRLLPRFAAAGMAAALAATTFTTETRAQTYFPSDVDTSKCSLSSSEFETWIKLQLPGVPGKVGPVYDKTSGMAYIFPPDGPSFKSDNGGDPDDCDFYKWGAQMFLWLTSTIDDGSSIPANPTFPDTLPYVFNSEFFYRLSSDHTQLLAQGAFGDANSKNLAVSLRTAKSDEDESIGQAGGSGVLLTQAPTPAQSSLTYYGVHVNRVYGYFTHINKSAATPEMDFPTTGTEVCSDVNYAMNNGYAEDTAVAKLLYGLYCTQLQAEASGGAAMKQAKQVKKDMKSAGVKSASAFTIPELEPAVDYLSMSVELKTSWVDASSVANKDDYILQSLYVPTYDKSNPNHWLMTGSEQRELALVGMHIVGTVEGHPEMVWATIEHESNAPNSTYYYMDQNGTIKTVSGPQAGSSWLYSNGTVVDAITLHARGCDGYQPPTSCTNTTDIVSVGDNEVIGPNGNDPIEASNVTRLHPWGNKQSSTDSFAVSQNTQIISLNRDVISNVKGMLAGDPRQHYFVSGAVWTSNGSIPHLGKKNPDSGDDYEYNTGSKLLANTTMETFHQDFGCFACHYSDSATDGLGVSHIYSGISKDIPKIPTTTPKKKK
ncbi:hypothetical protein [Kordiimonas aestuarii]|uniref:hypothetical protein n=1 Tax=Kordiimonas aestuarii TaxID=1005925 RepID=UPI0021CF8B58|nr:hypothetical protein [Kordiimonas aestuarii]